MAAFSSGNLTQQQREEQQHLPKLIDPINSILNLGSKSLRLNFVPPENGRAKLRLSLFAG
ncbi:hypothetical protein SADUNF_Sadunf05G0171000 [Salix dunnii]|uniref:Uncharacterized protein n=1 Tax=Salix dunnii TaxID=1413687 RepID=A0A835K2G1_9ROSI|nr:hypothetical protein SADUNF_Sadunf05G0171000 [Salix dunnii]